MEELRPDTLPGPINMSKIQLSPFLFTLCLLWADTGSGLDTAQEKPLPGAQNQKPGLEKLLKDHDSEVVKIYLHVFQLQRSNGWDAISDVIAATPALQSAPNMVVPSDSILSPRTWGLIPRPGSTVSM